MKTLKLSELFSCLISLEVLTYIVNLQYINRFKIDKSKESQPINIIWPWPHCDSKRGKLLERS